MPEKITSILDVPAESYVESSDPNRDEHGLLTVDGLRAELERAGFEMSSLDRPLEGIANYFEGVRDSSEQSLRVLDRVLPHDLVILMKEVPKSKMPRKEAYRRINELIIDNREIAFQMLQEQVAANNLFAVKDGMSRPEFIANVFGYLADGKELPEEARIALSSYADWYSDFANYFNLESTTKEIVKFHWGKTVPKIVEGIWPHLTEEKASEMCLHFAESIMDKTKYTPKPFMGTKEVFENLQQRGLLLCVLSSGNFTSISRSYETFIGEKFIYHHSVICEEHCEYHKPDPRSFDEVFKELAKLKIAEESVVYVGDNLIDYNTARNRGIGFVAVTTGLHSKQDFISAGVSDEHILTSFSDLAKLV